MKKIITGVAITLVTLAASVAFSATPAIIPQPQLMQLRPGVFTLCPSQSGPAAPGHPLVKIYTDSVSQSTGDFLAQRLFKSTGQQFIVATVTAGVPVRDGILLTTVNANTNLGAEGYELTVAPDSVIIRAPQTAGVFYGVQSLLQLLPPQIFAPQPATNIVWTAPCVYIYDQPQFPWRGAMLDAARHFVTKQQVKQVLDAMALHKLNTFHWHLTDDQGWRLEITNDPALTTNSAWRQSMDYGLNPRSNSNTNSAGQYGGFYTQADAREIVAYAQQLHITVVPEIEMPCHAIAALNSYPQYGCGNPASDYNMDTISTCGTCYDVDLFSPGSPGTMAFLEEILSEVMAIFPGQYIHCGGDEVTSSGDIQWNSYPNDTNQMYLLGITPNGSSSITAYQHWFSTNLAAYIQSNGHTMMGWTEYENGGVIPNAALMDWEAGSLSKAITVAEAGQKVVMTPDTNCYVNYVEVPTLNIEPPFIVGGTPSYSGVSNVYNFNPIPVGLPAQYDTNILGAQCTLFTEYVPSGENVMFKMFPRLCAMAEDTWTPNASLNYTNFIQRLGTDEQRLAQMGANYDHETIPQVGTWGPSQVPTTYSTLQWNITPNVAAAGEIDVSFCYTNGANGMNIAWASLLQNGTEIDRDTHVGYALSATPAQNTTNATLYILHLPAYKASATYSIDASVQGIGGTNSSGIVYLPNWD
jgi:hexosaminidase